MHLTSLHSVNNQTSGPLKIVGMIISFLPMRGLSKALVLAFPNLAGKVRWRELHNTENDAMQLQRGLWRYEDCWWDSGSLPYYGVPRLKEGFIIHIANLYSVVCILQSLSNMSWIYHQPIRISSHIAPP